MGAAASIPEPAELLLGDRKNVLGGRTPSLESIAAAIRCGEIRNVVVAAGAGISVSAGIPDFRSPGTGVYDTLEAYELPPLPSPESLFTLDYFMEHPEAFCIMARHLIPGAFKPTPTHHFIKLLSTKGLLSRVFTQNIDGLERIVGLPEERIVEAHGSFADAHCANPACRRRHSLSWWRAEIEKGRTPLCDAVLPIPAPVIPLSDEELNELRSLESELLGAKQAAWDELAGFDFKKATDVGIRLSRVSREIAEAEAARQEYPGKLASWEAAPKAFVCGKPVKPDIVFFGEALSPRFSYFAERDGMKADLLIVMGTSLGVMPFAGILGRVGPLCPRLLLNRDVAGSHDQDNPPMFFGNIGFRFSDPENYRDVFVAGDIDTSVQQFCELLGWSSELEKSVTDMSDVSKGFEIFEGAQATREEFSGFKYGRDYNHCLQLFHAMDADDDKLSEDAYNMAKKTLAESGQHFLPECDWFVKKDCECISIGPFMDGSRRLFEVLGSKLFHELLLQQLELLVPVGEHARSINARILQTFMAWDRKRLGIISREDMRSLLSNVDSTLPEDLLAERVDTIDQNGNGIIEYIEFVEWLADEPEFLDKVTSLRPTPKAKGKPKAKPAAKRSRSASPVSKARASSKAR